MLTFLNQYITCNLKKSFVSFYIKPIVHLIALLAINFYMNSLQNFNVHTYDKLRMLVIKIIDF